MLLTKIFLKVDMKWSQPHASDKAHFKVLQKEKEGIFIMSCFALVMLSCFAMLWPCHASLDKICTNKKTKIFSSTIDSPRFGEKKKKFTIQLLFTYHYSLLLFMTLFTSNFCLLSLMFETSFTLGLLSWREFLLVGLSLREFLIYYNFPTFPHPYKACN